MTCSLLVSVVSKIITQFTLTQCLQFMKMYTRAYLGSTKEGPFNCSFPSPLIPTSLFTPHTPSLILCYFLLTTFCKFYAFLFSVNKFWRHFNIILQIYLAYATWTTDLIFDSDFQNKQETHQEMRYGSQTWLDIGGLATLEESHIFTPVREICAEGVIPWTIFVIFGGLVAGWPGYNMVQKYPRKVKPLSRMHARHRRRTDGFNCHAISQT